MNDLLFFITAGLCVGGVYALIAVGYTLVYGIIKLINFAHGEFYMAGAYAGFGLYLLLPQGLPVYLSLPLIILASGIAGALIAAATERIAYKPIRESGRLAALLTAIGVSFLLQNAFSFVNHATPLQYPTKVPGSIGDLCQSSVVVGGAGIKIVQFFYLAAAAVMALALWHIVHRTDFGRAMRAVSQDAAAAALMGIDTDAVIRKTFMLGGFMAGVAGALVGFQSVIEPMMGFMPGLKAFVAAVLGGIGSIPGAVIGGFAIGVIENLVVWVKIPVGFADNAIVWGTIPTGYKDIAAFAVLILVLVIRPQGLLGKSQKEKV